MGRNVYVSKFQRSKGLLTQKNQYNGSDPFEEAENTVPVESEVSADLTKLLVALNAVYKTALEHVETAYELRNTNKYKARARQIDALINDIEYIASNRAVLVSALKLLKQEYAKRPFQNKD